MGFNDYIILSGNIILIILLLAGFFFSSGSITGHVTDIPVNPNVDSAVAANAKQVLENLQKYPEAMTAIKKYSAEEGVPLELVLALIAQESGGKPGSESVTGAMGLMQVQWSTAKDECDFVTDANDLAGKDNIENNIRCGITILKNKYDYAKDGKDPFDCGFNKYTEWQGALRAYNGMCCTYTRDNHCSACKINPDKCDDDYVEKVLDYYVAFGGMDDEISKQVEIPQRNSREAQYSKLGYYFTPSFNVKPEYDLSVVDAVTEHTKVMIEMCSESTDIDTCIEEFADAKGWKVGSCFEDNTEAFLYFASQVDKCLKADDGCACVVHIPKTALGVLKDSQLSFTLGSGLVGGSLVMTQPDSHSYVFDSLASVMFYYTDLPVDFLVFTATYGGDSLTKLTAKTTTGTLSGVSENDLGVLDDLVFVKDGGKLMINPEGYFDTCVTEPVYRICVPQEHHSYVYDSKEGRFSQRAMNLHFAVTVSDRIPPPPMSGVSVVDTTNAERSITVRWPKSVARDTVKYNIYLNEESFSLADKEKQVATVKSDDKDTYSTVLTVPSDSTPYYVAVVAIDASGNMDKNVHTVVGESVDDLAPMQLVEGQQYLFSHEKSGKAVTFYSKKPSLNSDGTFLRDFAGFRLYIDSNAIYDVSGMTPFGEYPIDGLACGLSCTLVKTELAPGTYYYTVTAVDDDGNEFKETKSLMVSIQKQSVQS